MKPQSTSKPNATLSPAPRSTILQPCNCVAILGQWLDVQPNLETMRSGSVSFPLTPALSPEEREHARQRVGESTAPDMFESPSARLPLPKGRGEGEQAILQPHVSSVRSKRRTVRLPE